MTECFHRFLTYYERSKKLSPFIFYKEVCEMTGKKFHRYVVAAFWVSLVFCIGFSYFYMKWVIPDKLNVVAEEEEQFHFSMPFGVTLSSDSEEVVLSNGSNIPTGQINLSVNQPFSVYSENQGSYKIGLKLFGWLQLKDIQVDTPFHAGLQWEFT